MIVVFHDHTHQLFFTSFENPKHMLKLMGKKKYLQFYAKTFYSPKSKPSLLYSFLVTVKGAHHKCIIRNGQPKTDIFKLKMRHGLIQK